jgi:hypothetical protein
MVAERSPHANRWSARVRKMVWILVLKANSGANPNSPWFDIVAAAF